MPTSKTPREMRQVVIDRALAANHTITDDDVLESETLRLVALDFIQSYTGTGYFMRQLHGDLFRYGRVTHKQMRGALNAMISEYKASVALSKDAFYINLPDIRTVDNHALDNVAVDQSDYEPRGMVHGESAAQRKTAEDAIAAMAALENAAVASVVPNGTYTVPINDAGEYRVIKLVDCPESFNRPVGTQIAKYQSGADNESNYTGFAFVNGPQYMLWRKFNRGKTNLVEHALVKLLTIGKHAEYGRLWAMSAGQCFICGRKLTVPISKKAGIGPVCAANTGIDIVALAALAGDKDQAIETNELRDKADRLAKAQADIDELFPE